MAKNGYKKDFSKLLDVTNMGALATNSVGLIGSANPAGMIPGMVGIGVTGAVSRVSFDLASGQAFKRRKRRR